MTCDLVTKVEKNEEKKRKTSQMFIVIEYIIIDAKLDIREMKVLAQALSKKESTTRDYIFRANCQNKTGSLYLPSKEVAEMAMISSPTSLIGVAFDRICGNHPDYMKEVKKYSN